MAFIKNLYAALPGDLNCKVNVGSVKEGGRYYIKLFDNEADELWSFVKKRSNVYYVWLVIHRESRQVVAFYVGDRSRDSARQLWSKIPEHIRSYGLLHTDDWISYRKVIPKQGICIQRKNNGPSM